MLHWISILTERRALNTEIQRTLSNTLVGCAEALHRSDIFLYPVVWANSFPSFYLCSYNNQKKNKLDAQTFIASFGAQNTFRSENLCSVSFEIRFEFERAATSSDYHNASLQLRILRNKNAKHTLYGSI